MIHYVNDSSAHRLPKPGCIADVRVVLFDLDGTLLDTIGLILSSFRHATSEVLGRSIPDEVLLRNVGVPLAAQMREFDEERTTRSATTGSSGRSHTWPRCSSMWPRSACRWGS
jgi:phosphoglycolate phosphatase-like HAD superfamily hydrolase